MRLKNGLLAVCALVLATAVSVAATAAEVSEKRLKEIYAMSPEKMAATGAWTRSNYDLLMKHINSIKDKTIRELVLDLVTNPRSTIFNATAEKNAFKFSPAAGGVIFWRFPDDMVGKPGM